MVMHRQLEALSGSQVVSVIVGLSIEQDWEAVRLPDFRPWLDVNVLFTEELPPEREMIQGPVEVQLRLDDRADADVRAEVRIEVGGGSVLGDSSVTGFQDHGPAGLLDREVDEVGAADNVLAIPVKIRVVSHVIL